MERTDFAALELHTLRKAWFALQRRWELTPRETQALLPAGGADDADPPGDTETRMRILIEVGYRIGLPGTEIHDWLRTASKTLGWLTPLDVMSAGLGDLRGLRSLVERGFAS
jgi:hypothetical protein